MLGTRHSGRGACARCGRHDLRRLCGARWRDQPADQRPLRRRRHRGPRDPRPALKLEVRTDPQLGAVVTGKDGLSLYVFTKDTTAGSSACNGDCAATWPPLTVAAASDATAGTGVSGALATITRADGSLQVTLGGKPLYYFKGDAAAGDTNGQGLNGVWYLASPTGDPRGCDDRPGAASPGASTCTGPTCY